MAGIGFEASVIFVLLLANGYFAMAEIAVVSARRTRLMQQAGDGSLGARTALQLAESPTRFLSTVQVGITVIGTLSGAYGGATIAKPLAASLAAYPPVARVAEPLAITLVVLVIAYLSVVVGELVPKRVALSNPERVARAVSRPMAALSRLAGPAVSVLEWTSDLVIKVLHLPSGSDTTVTEADVSAMVAAGTQAGVFEPAERRMVEQVLRLDDEPIGALMTPRRDIIWLDANDPIEVNLDLLRRHDYVRFPLGEGSLDRTVGFVYLRDVWKAQADGTPLTAINLRALARPPLIVPDRAAALTVLEQFRHSAIHVALVVDEHGGVDGLVTLNNLLMFVAGPGGDAAEDPDDSPRAIERAPGSWLVDGRLSLGDFFSTVGLRDPADSPRPYHTVAGLVMSALGRIPQEGDSFLLGPLRIEVADMDAFRVDKVLVTRTSDPSEKV